MTRAGAPDRSALILFGKELPKEGPHWWARFATIIAPETLGPEIRARDLPFEPLENFVDPGSIEEATTLLHELATLELSDGVRISESVTYKGYELWWMQYDDLYLRQCLPYTQYRRLLEHLLKFSSITLLAPPTPPLFHSYLEAHGRQYEIQGKTRTFPSIGIWLQVLISLLSWPLLVLRRPRIMVYTGDLFDPPCDYSFRMRFVYEELRARKLPFVEFIRSMEPTRTMLAHAWKRRRPVIYSYAIKIVLSWIAGFLPEAKKPISPATDATHAFKLALASAYLHNVRGKKWSIRVMNLLLRTIGIRAALVPAASSRTFHEVLGCRLAGIPTIGILHGAASRYYNVYDFIPEYRGEKRLGLDVYGMWSEWWRDYYLRYGKVYAPEQLVVSGPFRPLTEAPRSQQRTGPLRVLFIAEQLAEPSEIVPYLEELVGAEGLEIFYKFRPYRDGFEEWLITHRPDFLARVDMAHVLRGSMPDAIAHADVVVGSHSTAVLEALLQLKPMVFFYTKKWGDYFDLKAYHSSHTYFAENPGELIECIKKGRDIPTAELKNLQERFFGDPHKNGSAWAVDELQKYL